MEIVEYSESNALLTCVVRTILQMGIFASSWPRQSFGGGVETSRCFLGMSTEVVETVCVLHNLVLVRCAIELK